MKVKIKTHNKSNKIKQFKHMTENDMFDIVMQLLKVDKTTAKVRCYNPSIPYHVGNWHLVMTKEDRIEHFGDQYAGVYLPYPTDYNSVSKSYKTKINGFRYVYAINDITSNCRLF